MGKGREGQGHGDGEAMGTWGHWWFCPICTSPSPAVPQHETRTAPDSALLKNTMAGVENEEFYNIYSLRMKD